MTGEACGLILLGSIRHIIADAFSHTPQAVFRPGRIAEALYAPDM